MYYCLDYRTHGPQAEPRVTYIDVECQNDSELAISLTAFVQQFRSEVDECTTSVTRETVQAGLACWACAVRSVVLMQAVLL